MSRRILLLTQDFLPDRGGVSEYLSRLCQVLSDQIAVIAPHMAGDERSDASLPYPVYRYRKWPRLNAINVLLFTLWISLKIRLRACIISSYYSSHFGVGFWIVRLLGGIPYGIVTYGLDMSEPEPEWAEAIKEFLLTHADAIITISEASKQGALGLGAAASQIRLLPPCVNTDVMKPSDARALRRDLGLDGKRVLLTVSRLVPRKGHKLVLEAIASLRSQVPDLVYVIVGSGPIKEELVSIVDALCLQNNVVFAGFVSDELLPQYYSMCDLFVMPSYEVSAGDFEGFGIVYLEANSCGKPVIAAAEGGALDAVEDGVSGVLVPPNASAVADAIVNLLSDGPRASALGQMGRRRTIEQFSVPVFEARARGLMEELGNIKRRRG